jgi:hypothetical protein
VAHVLAFFQEFEGHFGLEGWGRGLEGLEGLRLRVGGWGSNVLGFFMVGLGD